jgi:hypothetical protein
LQEPPGSSEKIFFQKGLNFLCHFSFHKKKKKTPLGIGVFFGNLRATLVSQTKKKKSKPSTPHNSPKGYDKIKKKNRTIKSFLCRRTDFKTPTCPPPLRKNSYPFGIYWQNFFSELDKSWRRAGEKEKKKKRLVSQSCVEAPTEYVCPSGMLHLWIIPSGDVWI